MAKDQVSLKFSSARSQLVQRSGNWKFQWLLFVRNWKCDNFLWKRCVDAIMSCPQKSCVETIQCGNHPVVSIPSRVPPLSNFNKKFRSFCDFRAKITMPLAPAFSVILPGPVKVWLLQCLGPMVPCLWDMSMRNIMNALNLDTVTSSSGVVEANEGSPAHKVLWEMGLSTQTWNH